ncbi:MAG TPA: hypothetical protein VFA20_34075 [Myxococcaceae bacterium]|nr:hypothetical protein [Myxococcaceae bacterium]
MTAVDMTSEFGLVVRRAALEQRGVSYRKLLELMEAKAPLDANEELVSFGPHFGTEATVEFVRRLESAGLINIEDFFVFVGDFPEWCGFKGFLKLPST